MISSPSACATQPATAIDDAPAVGGGRFLHAAHAAEFGIDLFGRLLADVAGIEDDEVGVVGARGLDIALRRQSVRHTTRVVDVHLAAERFDVRACGVRSCRSWSSLSLCLKLVIPAQFSACQCGCRRRVHHLLAGFPAKRMPASRHRARQSSLVQRLDIGVLDDFRPFGDLGLDIGIEFLGATACGWSCRVRRSAAWYRRGRAPAVPRR